VDDEVDLHRSKANPKLAEALMAQAQSWIADKYRQYEALAARQTAVAESRDSNSTRP
jgi:hypothetical protein